MVKVVVTGATGFIGRRLCPRLEGDGHPVRAVTRHPENYRGVGEPVFGDVADRESLAAALTGCQCAYYLVHSLHEDDFERRDARAARVFGEVAAEAGIERIVYLGGLGDNRDDLSAHLRSRREVETLLAQAGVPVTTLRAGIIVGHGGVSWDMTRQLVERLPVMVTPRWVRTKTQPIAVDDVVRYLVGVLTAERAAGATFDIGGPDIMSYQQMMRTLARIEGRHQLIVPVPLLTPGLASWWLRLVTDVDTATGRSLIDSMSNEVIVRDRTIRDIVGFEPSSYRDAVLTALAERASDQE